MHMRYYRKTLRYYLNVPHVLPKWTFEKCCSFYKYFVVTIYLSKQLFSHFGIHLDFEGLWLDMECDHVNHLFFGFISTHIYLPITTYRLLEAKHATCKTILEPCITFCKYSS